MLTHHGGNLLRPAVQVGRYVAVAWAGYLSHGPVRWGVVVNEFDECHAAPRGRMAQADEQFFALGASPGVAVGAVVHGPGFLQQCAW